MPPRFICVLVLLVFPLSSYCQSEVITDGPYVSYQDHQITVSSIKRDDDLLEPEIERYDTIHKSEVVLNVVPENHADWAFQVKLKQSIKTEPAIYPANNECFFISDIEGEFAALRKILLAARVIDEQYNWTYGDGIVVIAGDLFDRGKDVVPELWLLYKLEDDARLKGGRVNVILGNHDIMNLSGDHRYADSKYFKNAWLLKTDCTGLFGKDTELGRWLRSKNIIEKIGDILVMHGGLSPQISNTCLSLQEVNQLCRPYYDEKLNNIPMNARIFFSYNTSPFWYRGYFKEPKISKANLDSTLRRYNCKMIVVGHTIIKWNIAMYQGGNIIGIDVDEHTKQPSAVIYDHGEWLVINSHGQTKRLKYKPKNDLITDKDIL